MKDQQTTQGTEYPPAESALYDAFLANSPLTMIKNYRKADSKAKWVTVGYYETEPRDWPSRSKEMVECAKFTAEGDAHLYANILARRPGARTLWAVVVR